MNAIFVVAVGQNKTSVVRFALSTQTHIHKKARSHFNSPLVYFDISQQNQQQKTLVRKRLSSGDPVMNTPPRKQQHPPARNPYPK